MAPSSANANASGSTACIFASEKAGNAGAGNARDAAEARADGLDRQVTAAQASDGRRATAISMPGQCGRTIFSHR